MNTLSGVALTGALLLVTAGPCRAMPIVNFDSSPAAGFGGVVHLKVGDTLTVDVVLSHLDTGERLDELGVNVAWDSTLLTNPTTPAAGPIVPDSTGFFSSSGPGTAMGVYNDAAFATGPIISPGTFFSFSVTAAAPGSGTISFSPPLTALDSGGIETNVTPGPDLSYDIAPAGAAAPEPSSVLLFGLTGLALAGHQYFRSRRRSALKN
jgi:hypothetical protein